MAFLPTKLPPDLQRSLEDFVRTYDFVALYMKYNWGNDNWQDGFSDILKLENEITKSAKNNQLKKEDVLSVVKWGNLRNKNVNCPEILTLPLYENEYPDKKIEKYPLIPLNKLKEYKSQGKLKGLGPTYLSKILRFALPSEFGAIDTRIVRVVGMGDSESKKQKWLSLRVRNDGSGWNIQENQSAWPEEYSKWINILRFFAQFLNNSDKLCPHPEGFLKNGLRTQGIWACADVEMALFSYASKHTKNSNCI